MELGEKDKSLKQIEDSDLLERMSVWSKDVMTALKVNPECLTGDGINILKLARVSGISKERIRKVLAAWRGQYASFGYDK